MPARDREVLPVSVVRLYLRRKCTATHLQNEQLLRAGGNNRGRPGGSLGAIVRALANMAAQRCIDSLSVHQRLFSPLPSLFSLAY